MNDTTSTAPGVAAPPRGILKRRLRAAAIHFSLSLVVFAVALYLILVEWYPGFHFTVDGGWQGVRIMAAVDLVLGPMLTLIVFNPLKARRLIAFDLTCIGLAQVAALIWGFYAIHSQHPVAVTYLDGTFHSLTAAPVKSEKHDVARLAELSPHAPPLAFVAPPANGEEEARKAMQEVIGGVAEWEDPFFFRPFAAHWPEIEKKALSAERRSRQNAAFAAELPDFLARHGGGAEQYRFFPYMGRYGSCTLALTPAGDPVGALGCEKLL